MQVNTVATPNPYSRQAIFQSLYEVFGNTAITIRSHDSTNPAVPAQITAARSYTSGGTQTFTWFDYPVDAEETRPGIGMLPFVNVLPIDGERTTDYVLNEGEGMAVQLNTIPVTGYTWSVLGVFSIE